MFIQKHIRSIIIVIIITVSLYLSSVIYLGWDDSIKLIKNISATAWLSLIACSFSSYLLRFFRWNIYIKSLGFTIPSKLHFLYYLSGFALTVTPAKVGETIRSLYLYNHGVSYPKSISTFFVERLLDLTVVTMLASLLLMQHTNHKIFILLLAIFILTLIVLLKTTYIQKILQYGISNIKLHKIVKLLRNLSSLLSNASILLKLPSLSIGLLLGMLAWSIQAAAFYILLNELGFNIQLHIAISIYSIALLSGAISFIPGGIGSTEIVMGVFLYSFGAPKEVVILAPIIIRMTSLWFAVLIGLVATISLTKKISITKN
ncbi:hypothetical protein MNBD_GAMMA22-2688 [hydrothermal vent metagenome]|uniref:Integral membrane protein n=1 Tax=hydrothermal vent metagenome TaxID=652676 RepID=A0A3B0ZV31_9ZZZZ